MDKKSNETEILYKYKSLKDLKPVLDIVALDRIYGAKYQEFNDPMEGAFLALFCDDESEKEAKLLNAQKWNSRICSFSKVYNNAMMWAHYADGFRGCCIGVEVKARNWKRLEVEYNDAPIQLKPHTTSAEDIFASKHPLWKYEKEVRYIKVPEGNNKGRTQSFFKVKVREIYFGTRTDKSIEDMITKIALSLHPELEDKIRRIKRSDLDITINK